LLADIEQAVIGTDRAGRIVLFSPAAERLFGRPAPEALGELVAELVPPETTDAAAAVRAALLTATVWAGRLVLCRFDGARFPATVTVRLVHDENGTFVAAIVMASDHTATEEAQETAQQFFAIVSSSADAIFTKALDGIILTWNRGAEMLYGYTADDVVGRHVGLLDPHETGVEIQGLLEAVAAGETVSGLETVRRHRDGTILDVSLTVSPVFDERGDVVSASVIGRDISDRRRLERQLVRQTTHDDVTGLPNRTLLEDRLVRALARSLRRRRPLAVLLVDLDRFSLVNAAHGYVIGDQVLEATGNRLSATVSPGDTVARFGGDAFVVLCEETLASGAEQLATRIVAALQPPIDTSGAAVTVSASIGIAISPPLTAESDTLLRHAQSAMYEAKAAGRGGWRVLDRSSHSKWTQRLELTEQLREALAQDRLELHYQPVVHLATGQLLGIEALLRWNHPTRGWVPPSLFVPLAEDSALIATLDQWVLERACRDARWLRRAGGLPADTYLAVNVSARNVCDPALLDWVRAATDVGLPLQNLELEVTETGLIADRRMATRVLTSLRDLGVAIALDDFGTGYSSLTYLRHLPISTLKVDREFIDQIAVRGDDFAITASVIDLGRAVGLRTVAEGVETVEQLAVLHRLGCWGGQGYLWSPALPRDALAAVLSEQTGFLAGPSCEAVLRPLRRGPQAATNEHGLHRIAQLHREGASLATIAAGLNAEHFSSPTHQRWHAASVARVIADITDAAAKRRSRSAVL
jgi:diguanylate cyclase (GGDEF)-like protein/PAS domain S-box-containing protein